MAKDSQVKLRYIPIGGAGQVTKNMHVFETDRDILIVDAGIGFPEDDQLGVDVVIPDVGYLRDRRDKIRGLLISHAHEDHIGGVPYLIEDLGFPPIYAAKLPRAFIQQKLNEAGLLKGQSLHLIEPDKGSIQIGPFEVIPYRVNHSVPDSLGFFIRTPVGNIVFSPDFKFDWTPVDGVLFEVGKLSQLVEEGVLALFSDCLGSNKSGYTESERKIQESFEKEMSDATGQVFITTMSSNISRIQQAINASVKHNRRVVPIGRSIDQNIEIALNLGYLQAPEGTITAMDRANRIPPNKVTYIIAGSFGQKGSALDRLARGENRRVQLREGAVVIFSADPIPGVADQVGTVIDLLTDLGARVVYSEIQDDLHVSGHGSQGDLSMMAGIVRPKYFVPMGGSYRHQRSYRNLMDKMGFDPKNVFELREDQTVEFAPDKAKLGNEVVTRNVFIDGGIVKDVGKRLLEERLQLAEEGILVMVVKKDSEGKFSPRVEVVSRGFVYQPESGDILKEAAQAAGKIVGKRNVNEWSKVRIDLERKVGSVLYQKTRRRPMILPFLVDL